jgi:phage tail sheath protein FI
MPAALTYPGVYIEEVPSAVRTIIGVATSITAFVGRARRGPTDRPVGVQNFADFERAFGGLWEPSPLGYAVQHFFANGGSDALIVRVHNGGAAATLALATFNLVAANEGDWGEQLRVRVDHDTRPLQPTEAAGTLFNLAVRFARPDGTFEVERFRNISVQPGHPRHVTRVLELESQLIRVSGPVGALAPAANAALPAGADPFGAAFSTGFNADGSDGAAITQAQIVDPALEAQQRGLWMLEQAELFNLLCIPPLARDTDVPMPVWEAAAAYCASRRAMLIVDPPAGWDEPADVTGAAGLATVINRTSSAAIYFPRIMVADPLKEFRLESFAPSGAVAGVIARTDATRGVWKAPAGLEAMLVGVSALSLGGEPGLLTDPQVGLLNPLGVNCLRTIPNTGHVVWGARTLDGADQLASQWKYLPVRRLAYFIEESLFRGTQWAVFEPNDEPLWAQLRLNVGTFMQGLFRQGAFQGASPREAYFVKCSRETTTQADIDAGIVNVLVGFAPLKPAEFVVIRIQQMTQQQP